MAPHAVWAQTIRHSPSRPSRQGCGHGTLMLVERLQTIPAFGHGGPTHKRGPRKERGRAGCRAGWPGRARPEQEPTSWEKSCAREDTGTSVSTRRTWYTIALRHAQLKDWGRPRYGNPRAGLPSCVSRERDSSLCHFCSRPELRLDLLSREEWEGKEGEVRGRPAASALDNAPGARAYACPRAAMRRTRPMTWAPTLFSLAFGFDVCVGCLYQFLFLCPWKAIKWRLP